MEVTYSGTMRCPHCGHINRNPIVLATNDDDTTLQCFSCGKDFEPSDELRWRDIPEAVLLAAGYGRLAHHADLVTHYADLVEALRCISEAAQGACCMPDPMGATCDDCMFAYKCDEGLAKVMGVVRQLKKAGVTT